MGFWKNYQLEHQEECDIASFYQSILNAGYIRNAIAEGITRQVISKGENSLSEKQRPPFQKYVQSFVPSDCNFCDSEIEWVEKLEALHNGGYCQSCLYNLNRIDDFD